MDGPMTGSKSGEPSMQRRSSARCLAAGLGWFVLACGAAPQPVDFSGPVADWRHYGGDEGGQRYSPLTQITRENVARLGIAWIYNSGDHADGRGDITASSLQVTPIV